MSLHHCHWPNCPMQVPPKMWGCKKHWFMLPLQLRQRVWATYVPGQEVTKTPTAAYIAVAHEVQDWIRKYLAGAAVTARGKQTAELSVKAKAALLQLKESAE